MVTNGDIGGEGGGIWHFFGDVFFEGPLKNIWPWRDKITLLLNAK